MHIDQRIKAASEVDELQSEYFDEHAFMLSRKSEVWDCLSPELYTIFWYLNIQQLIVPHETYQEQITKLKKQVEEFKSGGGYSGSSGQGQSSSAKRGVDQKTDKHRENLQEEYEKCKMDVELTKEFLKRKLKETFEKIDQEKMLNFSAVFIQYCIYPRLMFQVSDALYSFHFLKTLYMHRVPNFNMLKAIAEILKSILPSIHCCTSAESDNLGIFFLELFTLINEWYKQEVWERDCEGYSGFSRIVGSNKSICLSEFQEIGNQIQKRYAQNIVKCFETSNKHPMKT
jgi:THO complex subunit 2